MTTIPLPVPAPTIEETETGFTIHRELTELAKRAQESGELLTIDEGTAILCCTCGQQIHGQAVATFEPPAGFEYGGWFCGYCLAQGELASSLGMVIDQLKKEIVPRMAFNRLAISVCD